MFYYWNSQLRFSKFLPLLPSALLILIFVAFLQAPRFSACFHHLSSSNLGDLSKYADDSHMASSWNSLLTPEEDNQPHTQPLYITVQKVSQAKHTPKRTLHFPLLSSTPQILLSPYCNRSGQKSSIPPGSFSTHWTESVHIPIYR